MAKLDIVTASDLQHVLAAFDTDMDLSTLSGAVQWQLVSPAGALAAQVTNAVPRDNSLRLVDLIIGPALTASQSFTLVALNAKTAAGAALPLLDRTKSFAAPPTQGSQAEWPHALLYELTRSVGEGIQRLAGRASTRLVEAFPSDGGTAFVETTLGFPNTGAFFVGQRKYFYEGKTAVSFLLCTPEVTYPGDASTERSVVWCDPYAVQLEE